MPWDDVSHHFATARYLKADFHRGSFGCHELLRTNDFMVKSSFVTTGRCEGEFGMVITANTLRDFFDKCKHPHFTK